MATEFDNALHWGLFLTGTTLTSETGKYVRVSDLVLASLRAAGVFSNMVDGIVAPATDKLWLDKNFDPAVLKEWDATGASWVPVTYNRLFGRAAVDKLTVTGGTGNAVVVSQPAGFQANRLYLMTPTAGNGGATTITVSGVGAFGVKYGDGSDIGPSEFTAGRQAVLFFTGSRFEIVFPLSATAATNSVAALPYGFSTATADADPGAGVFRLNNVAPGSATAAYIDNTDADGVSAIGILDSWDDSTSAVRGVLTIRSKADPAVRHSYNVTGAVVDGSGYRKLTLAYVGGSGTLANGAAHWLMFNRTGDKGQVTREQLTANRTYFVSSSGSDTLNDGLSAGTPFLTIQKAVNTAYTLDLNGFIVTIQVADGTYTAGAFCAGPMVGVAKGVTGPSLIIQGNAPTPQNVVISTTNNHCLRTILGAAVYIKDMELRTTTSGCCLFATSSDIFYGNIRFGTCADIHKQAFDNGRIYNGPNEGGGSNFSIVGGAVAHEHAVRGSVIENNNATCTLIGTPAFSAYFVGCSFANISWWLGMTITGSATGPRYTVLRNGVVRVSAAMGGETAFPGSSDGVAASGGKYLIDFIAGTDETQIVAQRNVAVAHTGTTLETTLVTIGIPAGAMGKNGMVRVTSLWSHTNNANNKIIRTRFNGTAFASGVMTTQASTRMLTEIRNRNAFNSQIGGPSNFPDSFGFTTLSFATSAHDTSLAQNLTFTAELGNSADNITLEAYTVELLYAK